MRRWTLGAAAPAAALCAAGGVLAGPTPKLEAAVTMKGAAPGRGNAMSGAAAPHPAVTLALIAFRALGG